MLQGKPTGWYAPNYKILSDAWRDAKIIYNEIISKKNEQEKRIELITGGAVDFWSLEDPDTSRGRKYARVVVDEAAQARHLEYAWENVISATLIDWLGDAWFFSTPQGRNYFYKLFNLGVDSGYPEWMAWKFPTTTNPYIAPWEIEERRKRLPDRTFRQEYLAEFIEHAGAVFRKIGEALYTPEIGALNRHKGHNIYGGIDWGKHLDFTTQSYFCATCNKEIFKDRFNQIDYIIQRDRIKSACDKIKPQIILVELNAAEANFEMLQADGLPVQGFRTTSTSKPLLIRNFATSLEKEELKIIDDPIWTGELEAFEQKVNPNTGRSTYSAPDGLHDDTVIARCLAWWACTNSGGFELVIL